ncbi:hypothetical protein NADFUDRAFT_47986 [Nadsonia fulvescens var. elongata DSM 6958]|uniref:STEEP1 domain-containing protein n=1 Tax=Nadsonia fulvescens var. elongata DSM 6958 TaxID=857566 RepID=A0A1E3PE18_9ASCO|nr:hypothetical protein NADFUDRAFT_47986 [Nadsonia fulvescens var. elongata DSM 6958]
MDSTPYSCVCGQLVLTITPSLQLLPVRQTVQKNEPKSYVIPRNHPACSFKLEAKKDRTPILIKRQSEASADTDDSAPASSTELWWLLRCPRCKLPVGYDLDEENMKFNYILDGSLTAFTVDRSKTINKAD